ncbi:PKD domain-containing protein [Austwickia chelonae]|uniref:PKD domain-containing protein n=1 Tax=Austwickia chelonae TaxID=100225 RepID=UPI0013C33A82|nr:PKD domain-containing protein [Austwickia chelonae]
MSASRRRPTRLVCSASALALAVSLVPFAPASSAHADTRPTEGTPATAAGQALPTWQITGVAWAQLVVGNTVYVTGNFTKARPAGMWAGGPGEIEVGHLIAYDIRTGERIASFDHKLNAQGLALAASPDGTRLYVGGDFTTVDGQPRGHVAAFDIATGALVPGFNPNVNGQVKALTVTKDTLYAGGSFESAQGSARRRLASFRTSDGSMTSWAPKADDGYVWALLAVPDGSKVVIAGAFTTLSGQKASGTAAVHPTTGELLPWAMNNRIYVGPQAAITNLSTDGRAIYGGGYAYGTKANLEGTFSANLNDGSLRWVSDCLGDTYSTKPLGGALYVSSHAHDCSTIGAFGDTQPRTRWEHLMALTTEPSQKVLKPNAYGFDFRDQMAPAMLQFHPQLGIGTATGQYQASWHVDGNDDYVVIAGEFPTVNGTKQQGLARFPRNPSAQTLPPSFQTRPARSLRAPVASAAGPVVSVSFQSAWDPDNANLQYELVRDRGTATEEVVSSTKMNTNFWTLPDGRLLDAGAPAGKHTYSVKVSDGTGQVVWSEKSNEVTTQGGTELGAYGKAIALDGAQHYWRLDEPSGDAVDLIGGMNGQVGSGVERGITGALKDNKSTGMKFDGTVNGNVSTSGQEALNGATTIETWLRTDSKSGGRFLSFATEQRDFWGRTTINVERHLYMMNDGRIGLSADNKGRQIESSRSYNNGQWTHVAASLGSDGLALYVDGERVAHDPSYRPSGSVTGRWYIGGDRSGSKSRPSTWSLAGQLDEVAVYGAALTPEQIAAHRRLGTDGAPAPAANQAPKAAFTSKTTNLEVAVDGSTSTDSDGRIAKYSWNFGDSSTPVEGAKTTHRYAKAGTYTVELTVTDDKGVTNSTKSEVTVKEAAVEPAPAPPAAGDGVLLTDTFTRQSTSGWGNADNGGTWKNDSTASKYTVDGGKGSIALEPRASRGTQLPGTGGDIDLRMKIGYDQAATGGGIFSQIIGRGTLRDGYGARLWVHESGVLRMAPIRRVGGADTDLGTALIVPKIRHAAGNTYEVRLQITGKGTSTVKAKIWAVGTEEPADWMVSATDTTAALQTTGGVALQSYLSGSATTPDLKVLVDDIKVTAAK